MGWIEWNNNIWSYNSIITNRQEDESEDVMTSGLGICCRDLAF